MEQEPNVDVRAVAGGGVADGRAAAKPTPGDGPRLFVVHAAADEWFVDGFLLAALGLPEGEVLVSSKLEPGAVIVREIARGALSPLTVVVVSPALLASPWAQFASELAAHQSVEAGAQGATLVPAVLADCDLPLLLQRFERLEFLDRSDGRWEAEAAKLRARLSAPAPEAAPVKCPYPGMRAFEAADAAQFFGRDKEIENLLGRLRDGKRELYVIGPSGSGKSSLVAAGLVSKVREKPELAGGAYVVRHMRPGADPISRPRWPSSGPLGNTLGAGIFERLDGIL